MRCALCETDNPDDAAECATCGRPLAAEAELADAGEAPLEGVEPTVREAGESGDGAVSPLPDLELTRVAGEAGAVAVESIELERTQVEDDPDAPRFWSAGTVELDTGREPTEAPAPAPEDTGACPYCGAISAGALCDQCGRRRARYATPPPEPNVASGETVLCPACFSRVPAGARCAECGVPFAR